MIETLTKQPSKKSSGNAVLHRKSGSGVGVVSRCVHGPKGNHVAADLTSSELIEALRAGLPVQELRDLQASLAVPMEKLAPMLGISKATFHRRQAGGRLGPAESDRVVRYARLM